MVIRNGNATGEAASAPPGWTVYSPKMKNEFTAVVERDGASFVAYCPEIPGANGQGRTKEECLESLKAAIELILHDRRENGLKGVPEDAEREIIVVE